MDLADAPRTRAGEIHTLSFYIGGPSFVVATLLFSLGFKREARWRTYQRAALMLTALVVVAVIAQLLTLRRGMSYGLANRLVFLAMMLWLVATSIRLRAAPRDAS
jgi:hypothetical protein